MLKIPTKRIDSDDCAIMIGRKIVGGKIVDPGEAHYVHKGEWIEVIPVRSVSEYLSFNKLLASNLPDISDAVPTDEAGKAKEEAELMAFTEALAAEFERLVGAVADRVVSWNWTDLEGNPLDQPFHNPKVIEKLSQDELNYLAGSLSRVETAAERKNGSEPSPTVSSGEGVDRQNRS